MSIILASSSRYRRELLKQIHIEANCIAPDIDESTQANEQPKELSLRLACAKAGKIAALHPDAIVIGSDQVATFDNIILGKAGSAEKACEQLKLQSGKTVVFYTALCVQQGNKQLTHVATTQVKFRDLSDSEIKQYIALENPIDCAGSFKSEGLGVTLFDAIHSDDPSALVGLPLIRTADFLRQLGANPLAK